MLPPLSFFHKGYAVEKGRGATTRFYWRNKDSALLQRRGRGSFLVPLPYPRELNRFLSKGTISVFKDSLITVVSLAYTHSCACSMQTKPRRSHISLPCYSKFITFSYSRNRIRIVTVCCAVPYFDGVVNAMLPSAFATCSWRVPNKVSSELFVRRVVSRTIAIISRDLEDFEMEMLICVCSFQKVTI